MSRTSEASWAEAWCSTLPRTMKLSPARTRNLPPGCSNSMRPSGGGIESFDRFAKSYGQILGSNDRLNFAVIGLNGRALCPPFGAQGEQGSKRASRMCAMWTATSWRSLPARD
jgi:hypothetical protein